MRKELFPCPEWRFCIDVQFMECFRAAVQQLVLFGTKLKVDTVCDLCRTGMCPRIIASRNARPHMSLHNIH